MPSIRLVVAAGLAVTVTAFAVGPAVSQTASGPSTPYGYFGAGFTDHNVGTADLVTVQGLLGVRINRYFGLEGEVGGGLNREGIGLASVQGSNSQSDFGRKETLRIGNQQSVYAVGYLPLMPNVDLFGRLGAGRTVWDFSGPAPWGNSDGSWNLGAGGMYFWQRNGMRFEYLRETYDHGPAGDSWALSFVRRF